jgi:hypothetical protein
MTMHAVIIDRSKVSGWLVACTCGLALGPYLERPRAIAEARTHREATTPPREPPVRSEEERERVNAAQRARRLRKHVARATDSKET